MIGDAVESTVTADRSHQTRARGAQVQTKTREQIQATQENRHVRVHDIASQDHLLRSWQNAENQMQVRNDFVPQRAGSGDRKEACQETLHFGATSCERRNHYSPMFQHEHGSRRVHYQCARQRREYVGLIASLGRAQSSLDVI